MQIVVIAVLIVAVVVVAYYFSHDAKIRRELRNAPPRKIRELGDGEQGRIIGAAKPTADDGVLTAPLTGRPCVYYVARVEVQKSNGKSTTWRTLIKEEQGVPFVVEDETGRAIVDPMGARVSLDVDSRTRSGTFDDPTDREQQFLARHGQRGQGLFFNRGLRYSEAVIEENEVIAVLGSGVREPDPEAPPADAYRGDQPTLLRLTSSSQYPLVISDSASTTRSVSGETRGR